MNFHDLDLKVCTLCGSCVASCPVNVIEAGDYSVKLTGKCIECGNCVKVCSGMKFDFKQQQKKIFGKDIKNNQNADELIGFFRDIRIAYAADEELRKNGASGGAVSAFLLNLLEKKKVDVVLVVGMKGNEYMVKAVKDRKSLMSAQGSKYRLFAYNSFLKLLDKYENAAVVCLPCQVHGIRLMQDINNKYAKNIKVIVGLFCGFNMHKDATEFMIMKSGVKDMKDVKELAYRKGEWPGGFYLKADTERWYPKYVYDLLNLMYVPKRCLYCTDLTSEFADISFGDCWEKGKKKYSTVIMRSSLGEKLFNDAVKSKYIKDEKLSYEDLILSHKFNLQNKKKGAFYRIAKDKAKVEYGFVNDLSLRERFKFNIFSKIILVCRSKPFRSMVKILPLGVFISAAKLRRRFK